MITKFKIYENLEFNKKNNIEVGNYIIINFTDEYSLMSEKTKDFISTNIGQIVEIVPYNTDSFYVKYENIPKDIKRSFFTDKICININHINKLVRIIGISKNKKDLEYIIVSKNYNL